MLGGPTTKEWNLLKDQFDALVHDESVHEDSIEKLLDDQIRRRFGEWISRAAERSDGGHSLINRAGSMLGCERKKRRGSR